MVVFSLITFFYKYQHMGLIDLIFIFSFLRNPVVMEIKQSGYIHEPCDPILCLLVSHYLLPQVSPHYGESPGRNPDFYRSIVKFY